MSEIIKRIIEETEKGNRVVYFSRITKD